MFSRMVQITSLNGNCGLLLRNGGPIGGRPDARDRGEARRSRARMRPHTAPPAGRTPPELLDSDVTYGNVSRLSGSSNWTIGTRSPFPVKGAHSTLDPPGQLIRSHAETRISPPHSPVSRRPASAAGTSSPAWATRRAMVAPIYSAPRQLRTASASGHGSSVRPFTYKLEPKALFTSNSRGHSLFLNAQGARILHDCARRVGAAAPIARKHCKAGQAVPTETWSTLTSCAAAYEDLLITDMGGKSTRPAMASLSKVHRLLRTIAQRGLKPLDPAWVAVVAKWAAGDNSPEACTARRAARTIRFAHQYWRAKLERRARRRGGLEQMEAVVHGRFKHRGGLVFMAQR